MAVLRWKNLLWRAWPSMAGALLVSHSRATIFIEGGSRGIGFGMVTLTCNVAHLKELRRHQGIQRESGPAMTSASMRRTFGTRSRLWGPGTSTDQRAGQWSAAMACAGGA